MVKRKPETHNVEALVSAEEYFKIALKSRMRYRPFSNNLKSLNIQGRYLDIGAGPGIPAVIAAQNYPNVEITALEVSTEMVNIGKEYIKSKGLQERIQYVIGDANDEAIMKELGEFDLVYSVHSLHHWENPRKVIDICMKKVVKDGVLFIHDLRRVWWLYWVPINNGLFNSIRAAYIGKEIEEMLSGFRPESYEIKSEPPFMHSIIIRKS